MKLTTTKDSLFDALNELGMPHYLVCIDKKASTLNHLSIVHICGYEEKPTEIDKQNLIKELSEDEEFHMTDMVIDEDYIIMYWNKNSFE